MIERIARRRKVRLKCLMFVVLLIPLTVSSQFYNGADGKIHIRNADTSNVADSATYADSSVFADSSAAANKAYTAGGTLAADVSARWDSTAVKALLAGKQDTLSSLTWPDTLATVVTVSDTAYLHNQIILKTQPSDTLTWDATQTDIAEFITSASLTPYIDSARVKVLDGAKADSGSVVFWADSANELATNYDVSLKAANTDTTTWLASKTNACFTANFLGVRNAAVTASGWCTVPGGSNMAAAKGYPQPFAGSIVAIGLNFTMDAKTTDGTVFARAIVNGSTTWDCYDTTAGVGTYSDWQSQATGGTTFNAGDILGMQYGFGTFVGTLSQIYIWILVRYTQIQN